MNRRTQWLAGTAVMAALLGSAAVVEAQNATTGTIGGVVRDAQQGVLPGAAVVAVHAPTGTVYEAFARADGRFDLLNVQVGRYDLDVALSGFGTQSLSGVVVTLGAATEVPVTLQLATLTETVEVVAEASEVFSPSRSGTTAGVATGVIETLPTLERSLQDFARVNPFFVKTSQNNESESFLSVAGRSGRYNNIQIDGAVNNDLFGLARQGTPGGQANTQPISLDAVSELQLVVAPYDVRQSGFSGGGINVITRSGSNAFSGTGYFYSRNEGLVGSGVDALPIATFFDRQQGASVGGPLVRNRAFFLPTSRGSGARPRWATRSTDRRVSTSAAWPTRSASCRSPTAATATTCPAGSARSSAGTRTTSCSSAPTSTWRRGSVSRCGTTP